MEFDLYRNDGSILFSGMKNLYTTDTKTITVVASGFDYILSFKQVNSIHVAVVDINEKRITMVNRKDNSSRVIVDGKQRCDVRWMHDSDVKSYDPNHVELDERNPGHLIFTDKSNNALRSVDLTSGTVSTVIKTGFNHPRGLTWYNGRLLVCNFHYISEVSWTCNGAVSNNKLTTNNAYGHRDGDFSIAEFSDPRELIQIRNGLFLVLDSENRKLRILNMFTRKVLPVCIGSSGSCTNGTPLTYYPASILISDKEVYVSGHRKIQKLTGKLVN